MRGMDQLHIDPAQEAEYMQALFEKVRTGQAKTTDDLFMDTDPLPPAHLRLYYLKKLTEDPRIQVEEGEFLGEKPLKLRYARPEERYLVKVFNGARAMEEYLNSVENYEPVSIAETSSNITVLMRLVQDEPRWKRV